MLSVSAHCVDPQRSECVPPLANSELPQKRCRKSWRRGFPLSRALPAASALTPSICRPHLFRELSICIWRAATKIPLRNSTNVAAAELALRTSAGSGSLGVPLKGRSICAECRPESEIDPKTNIQWISSVVAVAAARPTTTTTSDRIRLSRRHRGTKAITTATDLIYSAREDCVGGCESARVSVGDQFFG